MAGWMTPEMNWAPKLASYSSSFFSLKLASTSRWRPNTLTSAWPVKASSTWALSVPVWVHCSTKRFFERLAMSRMVRSETGMVINAISASSGEMVNIMIITPKMVSTEVSIWLRVCWRLWATLSMSLVTRLSRSPRGWRSM